MINIRPVSDLRNKYPEIEKLVLKEDEAVYLTKNGYGSMVMMSLENYSKLTDGTNTVSLETDNTKKEHVEIISRPKKVVDEDDE